MRLPQRRRMASTIRLRLILLVAAILLPVAAFACALLWHFAQTERAHYRENAEAVTQHVSAAIDREVVGLMAALEALATSPALQQGGDLATFAGQAERLLRIRGTSVALHDRAGRPVLDTSVPSGAPLDSAGDPALRATDRFVFETGLPIVSDLAAAADGQKRIQISAPVMADGGVGKAIAITLDPARLAAILTASAPPGWTLSLMDRQNRIIARSRQHEQFLGSESGADLRRMAVAEHGSWTGTTIEGTRALGAYMRSPISGWRVVAAVPVSLVNARLRRLTGILGGSALLVLALSTAAAAGIARTISRPMHGLADAALRLGRGEPMPLLVTGLAEVDEVAAALGATAAEIGRREAGLQESEERFKAAIRAVDGVLWTNDREGRMTRDQPAWGALTGQSPEQYEGFGWAEAVHPEDAAATVAAWNLAVRERRTFVFEHRVRRHDGVYHRFSIRSIPVLAANGTVREWVGVPTDITAERAALTSLAESRSRLRAVFEAVPVGVVIAEAPTGHIVDGNAQVETIFRHKLMHSADVEAYAAWRSCHADGSPVQPADDPLARVIRGGEERPELEVHYARGDGTRAWVRMIAAPVRDPAGQLTGGVVAILDIDREKRAEAELRDLNATLERRIEQSIADRDRIWRISNELMLVARFDAEIVALNPAWATTLGWTEPELLGTSFLHLVHPDDLQATEAEVRRLASGAVTLRFENRYRHHDGTYRWLSWAAVPEAGLLHAIGRDVTAEREAADTLRRTEDQLRQSQKMEVVGQLTGGVAHDFNNLLTVITGHLEMARRRLGREDGSPRLIRNVESAMEGAHRAAVLVHRLLAFSRQSPLRPEPIALNAVVGGMSDLIRRTLGEHIRVHSALAEGLWSTEADPNQVENAILNLCVNARDAMPEGGTLRIESVNTALDAHDPAVARGEVVPGDYAMLAVSDTGSGIPAEIRERVFEPFFTTKPVGKGTGLGLSQVFGFLRQSGGLAALQSEVGVGTTVRLYFPRRTAVTPAEAAGPTPEDGPVRSGNGHAILVVEDDDMVREFTVSALEEAGYAVLAAADGPSALALLDRHPDIELLFTDVVLVGPMNGREVADVALQRRPALLVLFTTGYTRNVITREGRLDEDADALPKPFTAAALVEKVGATLARRTGRV
ncbi:MAG: hypothetical protein NVSMB18_31940 [Acetobacteraceae bacterium]